MRHVLMKIVFLNNSLRLLRKNNNNNNSAAVLRSTEGPHTTGGIQCDNVCCRVRLYLLAGWLAGNQSRQYHF